MPIRWPLFLCISKLILVVLSFLLQLIALCSSRWAWFTARTDLGKAEEKGHYGLWILCSTKGPHWIEDCDPLDTFYQLPPYSKVSGVVGILHLILLLSFIPLEIIRILQIVKNMVNFGIKIKAIVVTQVILSFSSAIFAILLAILISIGEKEKEYLLVKGWSFWSQISIIIFDVVVTSICVFESVRFVQLHLQQQVDPAGKRAETYGNPSFDAESPELPRFNNSNNGAIAVTESSGQPYDPEPISGSKKSNNKNLTKNKNSRDVAKDSFDALTYENECYQESSPAMERAGARRH